MGGQECVAPTRLPHMNPHCERWAALWATSSDVMLAAFTTSFWYVLERWIGRKLWGAACCGCHGAQWDVWGMKASSEELSQSSISAPSSTAS